MRAGYDADDIWMMVEDEFETLAHSFTRHLHHAEYRRLMQKAKQDAAQRKSHQLLPDDDQHPAKRRMLERNALSALQQDSLDRILLGSNKAGNNNSNNNNSRHRNAQDPWRGTSLQGLMATGNQQQRRSLKGLDRMPSSTQSTTTPITTAKP
ncbi:hypothetical protein DV735_g2434, partial [Chaetothyriales sp. CBS 134920]